MSRREQIVAACCGDLEQADLVEALLRRDVRPETDGQAVTPGVPSELRCQRCHSSQLVDETGFCSECGFQNNDGPVAASLGRASAATPQEGR